MSETKNEPQPDERDGRNQQEAPGLVWRKASEWVIETRCERYRIEKFGANSGFRYRVLKRTAEWFFELAPSETDPDIAKKICQADLNDRRLLHLPTEEAAP